MGCQVTVIARVENGGGWIPRLVDSLDAQTLPADEFETVFVVSASAPRAAARLAALADRRPHVQVVTSLAEADVRGAWVLDLGRSLHQLKPALARTALADLSGFAAEHGCDAVLGRVATRSGLVVDDAFAEAVADLGDSRPSAADLGPALALMPAGLLDRSDESTDALATALGQPGPVGTLGPWPVATLRSEPADAVPATEVTDVRAAWTGDHLTLTVRGRHPDATDGARTLLSLRTGDGREFWPPAGTTSYGAGGTFEHETQVSVPDLVGHARGGPGVWEVQVGVHRPGAGLSRRSPLPRPAQVPAAVVDDVLVVPVPGAALTLDVGATRSSVVTGIAPSAVTLHEDAAGTLLTIDLADVHVHGENRRAGAVLVDGFPLLAHLVTTGGRARVEGFVSGLPGRGPLGTQFGRGKAVPTGLDLVIAPVGTMTVAPAAGGPRAVRTGVGPSHGAKAAEPTTGAVPSAHPARGASRSAPARARALAGRLRRRARATLARGRSVVTGPSLGRYWVATGRSWRARTPSRARG